MNPAEYLKKMQERARKRYGDDVIVKAFGEPVFKASAPAEDQPFQIEGYATTNAVDLEGEVIIPEGIDWRTYFYDKSKPTNKTMFVDHEYDTMSAVGLCRNLKLTPRGLICQGTLIRGGLNPKRDWVELLAKQHGIGLSVVAKRIESGKATAEEKRMFPGARVVTSKSLLIEISYTPLPMNGECQAYAMPMAGEGGTMVQPAAKSRRKVVFLK